MGMNAMEEHHGEHGEANFSEGVVFLSATLFAAVVFKEALKKLPLPFETLVFLFGCTVGLLDQMESLKSMSVVHMVHNLSHFNGELLLHLCIPSIIYEAAFSLEPNMFITAIGPCFILGILGLIFCTIATAAFAVFFYHSYDWSWNAAIIYGSVLSATAPSAIMAHFRESGPRANLAILLSGESLINAVAAKIIFDGMIMKFATGMTVWLTLGWMLYKAVVAFVFSYLISMGTIILLRKIQMDKDIEVTSTICIVYMTYYFNEITLKSSGIFSVVVLGLFFSNYKSNIHYEDEEGTTVHQFWETLSFWATVLIYTIVGAKVAFYLKVSFLESDDGVYTFSGYFMTTIIRLFMVIIFRNLMTTPGYKLDLRDSIVVTWSSMRGAVALGMIITATDHLVPFYARTLLKSVSGNIFLTLLINGSTTKIILKLLGYGHKTQKNIRGMENAIRALRDSVIISEKIIRMNKHFADADWMWIRSVTFFQNPYQKPQDIFAVTQTDDEIVENAEAIAAPSDQSQRELEEDSRLRVLNALQSSVYEQHEHFEISRRTLHFLGTSFEENTNERGKYFSSVELINRYASIWRVIRYVRPVISKWLHIFGMQNLHARKKAFLSKQTRVLLPGFRLQFINTYFSERSSIVMFWCLVMNLITVHGYIMILNEWEDGKESTKHEVLALEVLNGAFSTFYIAAALIAMLVLGVHEYFRNHGNKIDFCVTLACVLEIIFFLVIALKYQKEHDHYPFNVIVVLAVLNFMKLIRLLRISGVIILTTVMDEICSAIFTAYDLSIGFITANREVVKTASKIIHYEQIVDFARFTAENNIVEMMFYKDDLEMEFLDVANAWITQRATIYVLRDMKHLMNEMEHSYMMDENDFELLSEENSEEMRRVFTEPKFMSCLRGVREVLGKLPWIKNEEMVYFIMTNSMLSCFSRGETIQEQDRQHQDVKIIVSGVIAVMGDSYLKNSGVLPNTDSLEYFRREGHFCDFLMSPDVIGVLGYLLNTVCVTSAACAKDCEIIRVSYETLSEAERIFGDFTYDMWRPIAMKIAKAILTKQKMYEYWNEERIKTHLEGGILPNLRGRRYFEISDDTITDMVLVEGRVQDDETKENYTGPCYIPSNVRKMNLLDDYVMRQRIIMVLFRHRSYNAPTLMGWVDPSQIQLKGLCSVHGMRRATLNLEQLELSQGRRSSTFGNYIRGIFDRRESHEESDFMAPEHSNRIF